MLTIAITYARGRFGKRMAAGGAALLTALAVVCGPSGPAAAGPVWTHVSAWGLNDDGQLGSGSQALFHGVPVTVSQPPRGFRKMAVGRYHSLAIANDGTVWAWGGNLSGQLGDGTVNERAAPAPVPGLTHAVDIAAGNDSSLAVLSDGSAWSWGLNNYGQLGLGGGVGPNSLVPRRLTFRESRDEVDLPVDIVDVEAGQYHGLALSSTGRVWTWGRNDSGQLGHGYPVNQSIPGLAHGLTGIVGLAGGGDHSLAVTSSGAVRAWGDNYYGQLGDNTFTDRPLPVTVAWGNVKQVTAGARHSMALHRDGFALVWGNGSFGQLGTGDFGDVPSPHPLLGFTGLTQLAGGTTGSVALRADGTVLTWGRNGFGQLGDGTQDPRPVPGQVSGLSGRAEQIAAGSSAFHVMSVQSLRPFRTVLDARVLDEPLPPGGSVTTTVSTTPPDDDSRPDLTLSAIGLPDGVTATFDPSRLIAGDPAELTLTAGPEAAGGTFTLTVTATDVDTAATYADTVDVTIK